MLLILHNLITVQTVFLQVFRSCLLFKFVVGSSVFFVQIIVERHACTTFYQFVALFQHFFTSQVHHEVIKCIHLFMINSVCSQFVNVTLDPANDCICHLRLGFLVLRIVLHKISQPVERFQVVRDFISPNVIRQEFLLHEPVIHFPQCWVNSQPLVFRFSILAGRHIGGHVLIKLIHKIQYGILVITRQKQTHFI